MIRKGLGIEETVEKIHESGGVAVAAHPFDIRGQGVREGLRKVDAVEAFNALSLDRFSNWLTKSKAKSAGKPMTSGTDAHTLDMVGRAAISADAHDVDSLVKAIRAGKVRMREKYVHLNEMKEWNRRRMINAYLHIISYIDRKYLDT